ncbi:MAG: SLC13 family permease [Candidatus Bathyarchaeota archaeon]|nr:SLC13 family permease [Candidatus Bathyarchaeota archaeon]
MQYPLLIVSVFTAVFVCTYVLIFTEKINRTLAALLGAVVIASLGEVFGIFSYEALAGFLDFETIAILIGMFIMTGAVESVGMFHFLAIKVMKASRGEPFKLLIYLSFLTVLLSAILSNIVAIMIMGSLTMRIARDLDLDPKPYMIIESILANLGGLVFLISSVPNIMIGVAAEISFLGFLAVSGPLSLILLGVTFFVFKRVFGMGKAGVAHASMESLDEWSVIKDRGKFYRSVALMITVLTFFAIGDLLRVGLPVIAITGSVFMLLVTGVDMEDALRKVGWSTILFIMGLFIIVGALNKVGVLSMLAALFTSGTRGNVPLSILSMLWVAGLSSAFVVDIPATAVLIPVVHDAAGLLGPGSSLLWWALIFGIGLGANFFPFSSSSTIIALKILRKKKRVSIKEYAKIGVTVCTIQLVVATFYLMALYLLL